MIWPFCRRKSRTEAELVAALRFAEQTIKAQHREIVHLHEQRNVARSLSNLHSTLRENDQREIAQLRAKLALCGQPARAANGRFVSERQA
jgi:hypothetical protein